MSRDFKNDVLEASIKCFGRYGYKKTTINDICKEANVARQTLYNCFNSKADILTGALIYSADKSINSIKNKINSNTSFKKKLQLFCDEIVKGYIITQQSPAAKDLLDRNLPIDKSAQQKVDSQFCELIVSFIAPYKKNIESIGLDIKEFADLIYVSLRTVKYGATNVDHLKKLHASCITFLVSQLKLN
ncbi:TetR/AcrR family transcriptional regulator [Lentisphaerota bacterium WC36G]|nr:TetR/AcrR family transcriptional regulator [Lentisphaerae bacterium WC36]